jgi:multidrug efflux pump
VFAPLSRCARPLGGGGGGDNDIQFVLQGPEYELLDREADRLIADMAERNPNLIRARKDYQPTAPRLLVDIDRERAAALGVSVADISRALQTHLGISPRRAIH